MGWAIPSFGSEAPPCNMGQWGDLMALPVPDCGRDWEEELPSPRPPHPLPPPLSLIPSPGPGAQPGVAGAAATVQCISRWAVEPDVGVGEGGADEVGYEVRGWVRGSWPWEQLRRGLDGNGSKSKDWPGSG